MNPRQIESWALRVIDCVNNGQPNEDFLVELKRDWMKSKEKAARRIAGHANAAQGQDILWLIGVDEKQGVIGVDSTDLASWYPGVESFFNELAPRMTPLNIPVEEKTIVALLFETNRSPFVVKNPVYGSSGGGAVELEVPWRENTLTRSARRADLIRLLSPIELLPEVEILDSRFSATQAGIDSSTGNSIADKLDLYLELYIIPKNKNRIVIPFHRCRVIFEIPDFPVITSDRILLNPAKGLGASALISGPSGSVTIESTLHEIIIDGPGKISLQAFAPRPKLADGSKKYNVNISVYLSITNANRPIFLETSLPYVLKN